MEKISDAMQNVVDEIRSSTEARGTALLELSENTKQLMKDIHSTSAEQAEALREKLSSEEKARVEAAREFMEEVGVRVSEMGSDTHNFLERFHLEHEDMAEALREKLSSEEKARVEATRKFIKEIHKANDERRKGARSMLDEVASDLRQARQIWTKGFKKVAPKAVVKKFIEEIEKKPRTETEKILKVIARHSEGIKLVDIGNELGVDWRTLIGPVRSLVENKDKIEKIDNMYYPK